MRHEKGGSFRSGLFAVEKSYPIIGPKGVSSIRSYGCCLHEGKAGGTWMVAQRRHWERRRTSLCVVVRWRALAR
ncbi:hypothetical protein NITHO_1500013 [Nitrolancea hollandica Lb]|uniref:Uncharacterized protein n=1 Tax=Nitrolancea hollandica Lb TaxID=1129897 RepID=I4EDI2_9BACT|nr:hypothetical protein NITHO_1500013 [Nitrolancea hollandica Lb]